MAVEDRQALLESQGWTKLPATPMIYLTPERNCACDTYTGALYFMPEEMT